MLVPATAVTRSSLSQRECGTRCRLKNSRHTAVTCSGQATDLRSPSAPRVASLSDALLCCGRGLTFDITGPRPFHQAVDQAPHNQEERRAQHLHRPRHSASAEGPNNRKGVDKIRYDTSQRRYLSQNLHLEACVF